MVVGAAAITLVATFVPLPKRVNAMENRVQQIERYIVNQERLEELMRKAPKGWKWDPELEEYVREKDGKDRE